MGETEALTCTMAVAHLTSQGYENNYKHENYRRDWILFMGLGKSNNRLLEPIATVIVCRCLAVVSQFQSIEKVTFLYFAL